MPHTFLLVLNKRRPFWATFKKSKNTLTVAVWDNFVEKLSENLSSGQSSKVQNVFAQIVSTECVN